jgi:hypothetical protein
MAKNCTFKVEKNILTITVDLNAKQGVSASGKSEVIATTEGNISLEGNEAIKIGLNIYTPVKK